jgi:hypothetical protein
MSLPPLNVKIGADTSDLERNLSKSEQLTKRFALGIAGSLAAVGAAMIAMTRRSMENADQLAKQARQVGLTTDRLQAMSLVAGEAGVSTQSLTNTLGIMQRNIVELERGTATQVRAFEQLGLSIANLQGLDADVQFERIAERLNAIQDPAQRTALAMEVFGRSGREVINMLDGYSEKLADATEFQRRFGIAISQTDAEAIERANDAVGRLREAFGGLGNLMAVSVAPVVEKVAKGLLAIAGLIADRYNPALSDMQKTTETAKAAQDALNAALGVFRDTAAPDAGKSAIDLANDNIKLAESAMDAARAEIAKAQAIRASLAAETGGGRMGRNSAANRQERLRAIEDEAHATEALAAAERLLAEAIAGRNQVARGLTGSMFTTNNPLDPQTPDSDTVRPRRAPSLLGEGDGDEFTAIPSIGGGRAVADQFAGRLEALQQGLQTEAEVIEEWYQTSVETLEEGLARKLLTEEEYLEARRRLEEEYAQRSAQIEKARQQNNFQIAAQGMGQILNAVGQGNEKMMRVAKAFNAGMAFIDTMAGAARELRKGVFGFATAAAVIARGMAFISAIRSTSATGGGGIAPSSSMSSGSGGSTTQGTQQTATTTFQFTLQNDPFGFGEQFARQFIEQLNQASSNGGTIRGVLT